GMQIPEPPRIRLASLGTSDVVGSIGLSPSARRERELVFPTINRAGKGDRLVPSAQPEPSDDTAAQSHEESPEQTIIPTRTKTGEIEFNDHSGDELPDAQAVVLAEL